MEQPRLSLEIGGREWPGEIHEATISRAVNQVGSADVVVSISGGSQEVDLLAPVRMSFRHGGKLFPQLTGYLSEVNPGDDPYTHLHVRDTATILEEQTVSGSARMNHLEWMSFILSMSGFPRDRQHIDGLSVPPSSLYHVVVPASGFSVTRRLKIGRVELYGPAGAGSNDSRIHRLDQIGAWTQDEFPVRARLDLVADSFDDAVVRGHQLISESLDWLLWRLTMSRLPWSAPPNSRAAPPWSRKLSLLRPRMIDSTFIRRPKDGAMACWGEATEGALAGDRHDLATYARPGYDEFAETLTSPETLRSEDERALMLALRAYARGLRQQFQVDQFATLWSAIEFLLSRRTSPRLFRPAERKMLVQRVREEWKENEAQLKRLEEAIAGLNSSPVFAKLQSFVEEHNIALSPIDWELLDATRRLRNDAVHGRVVRELNTDDTRRFAAIVAGLIWATASRLHVDAARRWHPMV